MVKECSCFADRLFYLLRSEDKKKFFRFSRLFLELTNNADHWRLIYRQTCYRRT